MLTFRDTKGSNLTAAEVDANFRDLDGRVADMENNPPQAVGISNITVAGTQMTIYLADGTVLGPYTLPQAAFRPSIAGELDVPTDGVYVPVLADANGYKRYTGSADATVLVPLEADVAFALDAEITFRVAGSGALSFDTATSGPTLNIPVGSLASASTQGATVTLKKVAADEWDLIGLLDEDA